MVPLEGETATRPPSVTQSRLLFGIRDPVSRTVDQIPLSSPGLRGLVH